MSWSDRIIADMASSSSFDAGQLAGAGIILALHRASLGMEIDNSANPRAALAESAGLLFGYYMLPRKAHDPVEQLNATLSAITLTPKRKLVIDWEGDTDALLPTFDQIFTIASAYQAQTGDAHPIIYGGNAQLGNLTDAQTAQLQSIGAYLWYARYRTQPIGIPDAPFSIFWQDACPDDDGCHNGMLPIPGNRGADYSRYNGPAGDLSAGWPFSASPAPTAP